MLENLKSLKEDMKNKGWTITSFLFTYKNVEYVVLVKRFVGEEKRISEYALVKLEFMKTNDLHDELSVEANSKRLIIDAKKLRQYFGIQYSENLGDILTQFTSKLGGCIPKNMPEKTTNIEKTAMVRSLSKSDCEDPRKVYCVSIRRNPRGHERSEFNTDKTRLLRPNLFTKLRGDKTISFCYSTEADREKTDDEILKQFSTIK